MIDIPLGKALVPAGRDRETSCNDCCFVKKCEHSPFPINAIAWHLTCEAIDREDGKNVIFKLVDYPVEVKNE